MKRQVSGELLLGLPLNGLRLSQMRRLPALLLPTAQPLVLGTAVSTAALLVSQLSARAQTAEAVAKVAPAITVRIEGATQGSGVLVKRDGNRYTVLTAWHVVSGQRPGEELDIYTPDGQRHKLESGSIKRLGEVDMAVVSFSSPNSYELAKVGDVKSVSTASEIYVAGFPLTTPAVPKRIFHFSDGKVIANTTKTIPNGYQLLYSNFASLGMAGGAVLNSQGQLVGIHGQGETDRKMSEQQGVAVMTGSNQAVPIAYYNKYAKVDAVDGSAEQGATADEYLAKAKALLGEKGREQEVIKLAEQVLAIRQNAEAYLYRAEARFALGDKQGALADCNKALAIDPQDSIAYNNRGNTRSALGDMQGAISDYNKALAISPNYAYAYNNRGLAKDNLGNRQGAIADYSRALLLNPKLASAYNNRGVAKYELGDKQGACSDYKKAISLGNQSTVQWLKTDDSAWCRNMP